MSKKDPFDNGDLYANYIEHSPGLSQLSIIYSGRNYPTAPHGNLTMEGSPV